MGNLVYIMGEEIFTNSFAISQGLDMEHKSIMALIKTHSSIDIFKDIKLDKKRLHKKEAKIYLLTEMQATFLISLMKNSPKVIDFKAKLVKEFFKQRELIIQILVQKQNVGYIEARAKGKVMRRECTDTIQEFIAYAESQGSKSATKYYMNFSRMELTGLFLIEQKYPNARDVMSMRQLNLIEMADEAVAISLEQSMADNVPYKECYQIAKEKICLLAKIFPRSPLPEGIALIPKLA